MQYLTALDTPSLRERVYQTLLEALVSGVFFYLFIVHTATARDRSFINLDLMKSPNFMAGTVLMFFVGGILSGTLALLPTMLQSLMNYPVFTTGLVTAPRGIGTMVAMFVVGRMINRVDNRLIILTGFLLGLVEGLTKVFYPEASNTVIFIIMAIVLMVRPAGLFGARR